MWSLKRSPLLMALGAMLGNCSGKPSADEAKPNVLLIMLDDMGYSDLGCYGGEIQTPNIDRLAADGVRFTQMYNCARSCPTRASLLTGHYPQAAGINGMGVNLSMNTATIAEVLKDHGYQTGMTGKWHLSQTKALPNEADQLNWLANRTDHGPFSPLENYPCQRGFQDHWGVIWGVVNFFDPFSLVHNEEPIRQVPDDFYMTDFITQKSIDLIDTYSKSDKPFFLYVAHTAPHWPLHARKQDIEKYKDTYTQGWDVLRETRYRKMAEMGLIDTTVYRLPANSSGKKWTDCKDKAYESACMAVHAAMIDRVDQGVGMIVKKLKETGQYENTIIFILSDNGASYERGYPPGFDRPGFTRDSTIIQYNAPYPGAQNTWNYIGSAWANAANTPFRFWKKESYEGGTATPFIVHWPKGLKHVKKNAINQALAHIIDIMPTCLQLGDAAYPDSINGLKTIRPVGTSMLPLFTGQKSTIRDTLYWEHEGGRAIRAGDWKMAALPGRDWELFHISVDRTEKNNLAAQYPEKVDELNRAWKTWALSLDIK